MTTVKPKKATKSKKAYKPERPPNVDHLHCSAEWHLREIPRAALVYSYAMRICEVGSDGRRFLWLSQRQLAAYFQVARNTIDSALSSLQKSGLFRLISKGGGDQASKYEVFTHGQLSALEPNQCKPKEVGQKIDLLDLGRSENSPTLGQKIDLHQVRELTYGRSENLPRVGQNTGPQSSIDSPKDLPNEETRERPSEPTQPRPSSLTSENQTRGQNLETRPQPEESTARLLAKEKLLKAEEREAIRNAQSNPRVMDLSDRLINLTGEGLSGASLVAAADLLQELDVVLLFNAFNEYYEKRDEFEQKHAIRKFFAEGMAPGFIESQRKYRERRAQDEIQSARILERVRVSEEEQWRLRQEREREEDGLAIDFAAPVEVETSL